MRLRHFAEELTLALETDVLTLIEAKWLYIEMIHNTIFSLAEDVKMATH